MVVLDLYQIPVTGLAWPRVVLRYSYLDPDFVVYTLLFILDLLFDGFQGGGVWRSTICFENLDIPSTISHDFSRGTFRLTHL